MKNVLLRGTILLTLGGIFSRIIGFFYRIFLANTIGAEGMGIYQLIFPIYSVCFSLCASGIETAISKLTAEKYATGKPWESRPLLQTGISICLFLSLSCSILIYRHADSLALFFLKEPRCTELLKILSITVPFGTAQSCICGYYFGIHKAGIPAASQLAEQLVRVGSVCLLSHIYTTNQMKVSPALAVIGLVLGEVFSFIFTITCFSFHKKEKVQTEISQLLLYIQEILHLSAPLTISRICINLLTSLEATFIPHALKAYGMNGTDALSMYGVLTGMALPVIFFPSALTSSISLMLLPAVSNSYAGGQFHVLKNTVRKTFSFCAFLGGICFLFFLIFGQNLGNLFFSSSLAGNFISALSWICPFLYLNTTLNSVLNGLGKTATTFFTGTVSLFLRIGFISLIVPSFGIYGYFLGLLVSQLFVSILESLCLWKTFRKVSEGS